MTGSIQSSHSHLSCCIPVNVLRCWWVSSRSPSPSWRRCWLWPPTLRSHGFLLKGSENWSWPLPSDKLWKILTFFRICLGAFSVNNRKDLMLRKLVGASRWYGGGYNDKNCLLTAQFSSVDGPYPGLPDGACLAQREMLVLILIISIIWSILMHRLSYK